MSQTDNMGIAALKLADRVAVITGGTKGIGLGCARIFGRHGTSVVIAARNEHTGRVATVCMVQIFAFFYFQQEKNNCESSHNPRHFVRFVHRFRVCYHVDSAGGRYRG